MSSSSTSTAALDEIRDLVGFINHHNAQVRLQVSGSGNTHTDTRDAATERIHLQPRGSVDDSGVQQRTRGDDARLLTHVVLAALLLSIAQACKMVTSLSASSDNHALIAQVPSMIPALAKQMTDVKEISREVYKALINLAESEDICQNTRTHRRRRRMHASRQVRGSLSSQSLVPLLSACVAQCSDQAMLKANLISIAMECLRVSFTHSLLCNCDLTRAPHADSLPCVAVCVLPPPTGQLHGS